MSGVWMELTWIQYPSSRYMGVPWTRELQPPLIHETGMYDCDNLETVYDEKIKGTQNLIPSPELEIQYCAIRDFV